MIKTIRMELHQLRCFVGIAECLSFTKAARALRISQPALTKSIHNLEGAMGVELFVRSKMGVTLTEAGKVFQAACQQALATIEQGAREAKRAGNGGTLRIAYSNGFDYAPMQQTITAFHAVAPKAEMSLRDLSLASMLKELQSGQVDVGFIGCTLATVCQELVWESIARHSVTALLSSRHPCAKRKRVELHHLRGEPFLVLSERVHPGYRGWLQQICGRAGFNPDVLQEVETENQLQRAVSSGFGVALCGGRSHLALLSGVTTRPLLPETVAEFFICWNKSNPSKALASYLGYIRGNSETEHSLDPGVFR